MPRPVGSGYVSGHLGYLRPILCDKLTVYSVYLWCNIKSISVCRRPCTCRHQFVRTSSCIRYALRTLRIQQGHERAHCKGRSSLLSWRIQPRPITSAWWRFTNADAATGVLIHRMKWSLQSFCSSQHAAVVNLCWTVDACKTVKCPH